MHINHLNTVYQPFEYCIKATDFIVLPGESFVSLSIAYRLGERTLSCIVGETCIALVHVMKDKCLQVDHSVDNTCMCQCR